MTKNELLWALSGYPDDYVIILSSDAEGNNYSPLASCSKAVYIPETSYSGGVLDDEEGLNYNAIVLYPVN